MVLFIINKIIEYKSSVKINTNIHSKVSHKPKYLQC